MATPLLVNYDKLMSQITAKQLVGGYLLLGNEPLQLTELSEQIIQLAQLEGFTEKISENLTKQTDWEALYLTCSHLSLFDEKKILYLILAENLSLNGVLLQQLENLLKNYLHSQILFILQLPSLSKAQEKQAWFQSFPDNSRLVRCEQPNDKTLPSWIKRRAFQLKLQLDTTTIALLCQHYEGNLLILAQILDQLRLLYPDGKINVSRVHEVLFNMAIFTPYEWLSALMQGQEKRSIKILHQLRKNDTEPLFLIRTLQRELVLMLQFKVTQPPSKLFFETHKIWSMRRTQFISASQRLSLKQIKQLIQVLTKIECDTKEYRSELIWESFEIICLLFSTNSKALALIHDYK